MLTFSCVTIPDGRDGGIPAMQEDYGPIHASPRDESLPSPKHGRGPRDGGKQSRDFSTAGSPASSPGARGDRVLTVDQPPGPRHHHLQPRPRVSNASQPPRPSCPSRPSRLPAMDLLVSARSPLPAAVLANTHRWLGLQNVWAFCPFPALVIQKNKVFFKGLNSFGFPIGGLRVT